MSSVFVTFVYNDNEMIFKNLSCIIIQDGHLCLTVITDVFKQQCNNGKFWASCIQFRSSFKIDQN